MSIRIFKSVDHQRAQNLQTCGLEPKDVIIGVLGSQKKLRMTVSSPSSTPWFHPYHTMILFFFFEVSTNPTSAVLS